MNIRVTITVDTTRADGSQTSITETTGTIVGDNPHFEESETMTAIARTTAVIGKRIGNVETIVLGVCGCDLCQNRGQQ